ncbi:hypothetical protein HMPREF1212_05353 [Parabacteroides sp. HGS0025]|nr:hypothetical protein HMPREF1212_05353 [Parabacteroides sp. HGS0025]
MIIGGFIVFNALCWLCIARSLINAPTDVELWGEEIE